MGARRSSGGPVNAFLAYLEARADAAFVAAKSAEGHAWVQGGNSFGVTGVLGTNDANPLQIRTSGVTRGTFDTSGNLTMTGNVFVAPGGAIDTSAAGTLFIGGQSAGGNATTVNIQAGGGATGGIVNIGTGVGSGSTVTITSDSGSGFTLNGNVNFKDNNLNTWLQNTPVGSAVNFVKIANAAAGTGPTISAAGTDTNILLTLQSKGTAGVNLLDGNGNALLKTVSNASAVNFIAINNAATAQPPIILASGTDTNVDLLLQNKGAGRILMNQGNTTNPYVQLNNTGAGLTASVTGSTGAQFSGAGQNIIIQFTNSGGASTSGVASFLGGDNSATSRIIVDFREAGTPGTIVGSIAITTSVTAFNTSSDRRLKRGIEDTRRGLADIKRIRIRDFGFKADEAGAAKRTGVIAQEIVEVFPECVTTEASGEKYMQVDYSKLTPLCVKAIQELEARIAGLESRLAA